MSPPSDLPTTGSGDPSPAGFEEGAADASPLLGRELAVLRPKADALRLALLRARLEARLFGAAEPVRVGRFVLLGQVTSGGMGAVYSAYDPQLERRVALKVLHPEAVDSEASRQRLLAEARALARLDHPNVVPVHDALMHEGEVVVVMEWVEGQTLASWERAEGRSWREIVAVYLAAGQGLAAAHRLGLVHRDFKPSNAIIGADGRVRILDFGLARFDGAPGGAPEGSPGLGADGAAAEDAAGSPLTAPGQVLGTLAFMAPEQLEGKVASAAADQFSFCVALYRAVCGAPPYSGTNRDELLVSLREGRLGEPRPGAPVPRWLRAVLARGLQRLPAHRHPSMEALLAELSRVRGWRRWRTQALATSVLAAVLVSLAILRGVPAAPPSCDRGGAEVSAAWGPAQHEPVRSALARAGADPTTAGAVVGGLERYRDDWVHMHRTACLDHRGGAQSDLLLDQRMLCLRRRKDALAGAVRALRQVSTETLEHARLVVAQLARIADCAEVEQLTAAVPLPPDAAARAAISSLEAQLAEAVAIERLGRSQEGLAAVRGLEDAAATVAYPPLLVEVKLSAGRMLLARGEYAEASTALASVEQLALRHGLWAAAVEAGARRIYCQAMEGVDLSGLLRQAEVLEPMSGSLRGDRFARPLLLNNVGVVHNALEQRDQARASFEAASALLAGIPDPDLELSAIDLNLAMLTHQDAAREGLARRVWELRRSQLGEDHLLTLASLLSYGKYVRDPARALPLLREACARYRARHPQLLALRAHCGAYLGLLHTEVGEVDAALAAYDEVVAITAPAREGYLFWQHQLARGAAARQRGQLGVAREAFGAARAALTGEPWMVRAMAAVALLGELELLPVEAPARLRELERAVAVLAETAAISEDTEWLLRLARARTELALRGWPALTGTQAAALEAHRQLAIAYYRSAGAARLAALAAPPGAP